HRDALARQAAGLKLDTILAGLDVLNTAKARLRGSGHPRVLMEMALVRLSRLDDLVSLTQLAQWLGQPQAARAAGPRAQPPGVKPGGGRSPAPVPPPEGVKKSRRPHLTATGPRPASSPRRRWRKCGVKS